MNLPPALIVLPGPKAALAEGDGARVVRPPEARDHFRDAGLLVVHAALTARRLRLEAPPRTPRLLDVLELFAFVRPGAFTAPSAAGRALALGEQQLGQGLVGVAVVGAPDDVVDREQHLAGDDAVPGEHREDIH